MNVRRAIGLVAVLYGCGDSDGRGAGASLFMADAGSNGSQQEEAAVGVSEYDSGMDAEVDVAEGGDADHLLDSGESLDAFRDVEVPLFDAEALFDAEIADSGGNDVPDADTLDASLDDAALDAAADTGLDAEVDAALGSDYPELEKKKLDKMRECGALGAGEYNPAPIVDELGKCNAQCIIKHSCAQVVAFFCKQPITPEDLQSCFIDCAGLQPPQPFWECGPNKVWLSWRCDGRKQCRAPNATDEVGCATYTCANDGGVSTNPGARCDGVPQCPGATDELGCASLCPSAASDADVDGSP